MKIDRSTLLSEFDHRAPEYKRLLEESHFILEKELEATGVKIHSIPARVKSAESFVAKVARKGEVVTDPFTAITDIVGLRVVCLFLSDVNRIGEVIKEHFDVVSEDNKIDGAEIASFGYMSLHFVARLKKNYSGPRYKGLLAIPLEIQVRTIAMDAWATISHYLDYKSDADVPRALRRDFYALSGLFYVADSHFELFFRTRELGRLEISAEIKSGEPGLAQEINLDTLQAYLRSRFPERVQNASEDVSELVSELHSFGYTTLSELDEAISHGFEAFLAYERQHPPSSEDENDDDPRFQSVGVVRILLSIYDPTYAESISSMDYSPFRHLLKKSTKPRDPEA
jgi:putative GTP pyrophosphokinase